MNRASVWFAWGLVALSLTIFGIGLAFTALTPASPGETRFFPWPLDDSKLKDLIYVAVGALIVAHRPRNPIGWLFCVIGLVSQISSSALDYATYLAWAAPPAVRMAAPALVLAANTWIVAYSVPPAVLIYFPSGQLLSQRWRLVVWLLVIIVAAGYASLGTEFAAGSLLVHFPSVLNLLGFNNDTFLANALFLVAGDGDLLMYALGALAILLRFRRAHGDERQQLKWFAYAALVFAAVVVTTQTFFDQLHPLDPSALHPTDLFLGIPYALAQAAIPVAAAIAILRYRLYDIDLVIRRTLVYGALTGLLALVYLGAVIALQTIFTAATGAARSELVTVLSTLIIAALFVPLRRRVQAAIDRRFYRRKYDAARILAQFGAGLRDEVDLDKLSAHLLSAVDETIQPESVALWLKGKERA